MPETAELVYCEECHMQIPRVAFQVHAELNHISKRVGQRRREQLLRVAARYGRMTKKRGR